MHTPFVIPGLLSIDIPYYWMDQTQHSTTSQLGYMMFTCGIDNYFSSIFHLFVHAFFKSLLFLTAGFLLHYIINEVHIYKLSGFSNVLPLSYNFMFIACLSLIGWPTISCY